MDKLVEFIRSILTFNNNVLSLAHNESAASRELEVTEPRDRVVKLGLTLRPLKRGNLRGESVETEEAAM
ncbi:hypothetical protein FCV25MIE_08868 [Fagus crenata]